MAGCDEQNGSLAEETLMAAERPPEQMSDPWCETHGRPMIWRDWCLEWGCEACLEEALADERRAEPTDADAIARTMAFLRERGIDNPEQAATDLVKNLRAGVAERRDPATKNFVQLARQIEVLRNEHPLGVVTADALQSVLGERWDPLEPDRLEEIKKLWSQPSYDPGRWGDPDIRWLIAEVERLRAIDWRGTGAEPTERCDCGCPCWICRGEAADPPANEVVMPVAVAERIYRAIIGLPADLTPELCEATEDFYRYVRLRGALRAGGPPEEESVVQLYREMFDILASLDDPLQVSATQLRGNILALGRLLRALRSALSGGSPPAPHQETET